MPKRIAGNIVGLPSPRSDWNQTDEMKADFIKNKPIENVGHLVSSSSFNEERFRTKSGIFTGTYGSMIKFLLIVTHREGGTNQLLLSTNSAYPVRYRTWVSIEQVWGSWERPRADRDGDGNNITETYATKNELRPTPERVVPTTLNPNTDYNFSVQEVLTLTFPSVAKDGDVICISFLSYDTATNLTIDTTNTNDIDLVPEVNTGYEIYAKYNMDVALWIVKYSEYSIEGM